ncbi:MAG: ABC transporter ATP-binding protein [Fimbriimonadaceae bacterium]|nr:ABC transporter ATP-binding protein [Fimbriimonadaceae bacterium]
MLEVRSVSKSFGALKALDSVSATFQSGEIHAVLGENGAGKSTLMHVLSGFLSPDSGAILLDGSLLHLGSPGECRRLGIGMVHQHFTLVPNFTVAENLTLSNLQSLPGSVNPISDSAGAIELAAQLGWEFVPDRRVGELPVGTQQRIEIIKVLAGRAEILIFDEPTAVLTPDEVEDLFRVLRKLRDEKKTVILIAHKLSEVMAIADHVTVLRRGKRVASASIDEVNSQTLAEWMVGSLPAAAVRSPAVLRDGSVKEVDLTILGDRGEIAVKSASFEIGRGEIVGFGGVDGNGQVELAEALAGLRSGVGIEFQGTWENHLPAYIPQDRQTDGLALGMTVEDNLLIGGLEKAELGFGPFLNGRAIRDWSRHLIDAFAIKVTDAGDLAASLSGGNQQKIIVSRTLDRRPEFLVVVNPTRGLDIRAADYVHTKLLEARDAGTAIALFSTDLDELNLMADRTYFMSRGELREGLDALNVVGGP